MSRAPAHYARAPRDHEPDLSVGEQMAQLAATQSSFELHAAMIRLCDRVAVFEDVKLAEAAVLVGMRP